MTVENKIKVVEVSGTPFEQGTQYGEALREELELAREMCLGGVGAFYSVERDQVLARAMEFLPAARAFDFQIEDIIRGQAEGSGLSFEEAFALRCTLELMFFFQPGGAGLCTSFAASGEATASGGTLLGQNIDWFTGTPLALLRQEQPGGLRQLTLCLVGISEYTLSSAGFGVCANGTISAWTPPGPGIPYLCYMPRVMRQKSLAQARELLESAARGVGYFHLASADGSMFGIESNFSEYLIMEPEAGVLVHSNHYLSESFQAGDVAGEIFPDSFDRHPRIKELVAARHGKLTPEVMKQVLGDHQGHPNSICRHPDPAAPPHMRSETLGSFIMEPGQEVMHVALGNPCESQWEEFSL